jgi:hypothetical protein
MTSAGRRSAVEAACIASCGVLGENGFRLVAVRLVAAEPHEGVRPPITYQLPPAAPTCDASAGTRGRSAISPP